MPSTTKRQLNFFRLVNAIKKKKVQARKKYKKAFDVSKQMTERQIRDFLKYKK